MKTTTTKLITKVDSFIQDIDFENKDNINQFSELLGNLKEKQIKLKEIILKIEEFITDNTFLKTEVQNSINYNDSNNKSKCRKKANLKKFKNDVELSKISTLSNASTVSYVST